MTKTFSTLVAALAITASLAAVTPVSADSSRGEVTRTTPSEVMSGPISGGDLGSGRITVLDQDLDTIAGGGLGSGR
ncbi:hypothetical protein [Gymnodinialimonas sp.]